MTNVPPELAPVVDTVVRNPDVAHAWNTAAPIEDLVTVVILAATPHVVDRAIAHYKQQCAGQPTTGSEEGAS